MATGHSTSRVLVGLSVKLEVLTKDKLRKFVFDLKKAQEDGLDKWTVDFELLDRAETSAAFERVVFLAVEVDLKKVDEADVQATADKGLNKAQVDFALTTVAADAEKLQNNKIKESRMTRTVGDLFGARND